MVHRVKKNRERICFVCGKKLLNPVTRASLIGTERQIRGGEWVKMHKICAVTFDTHADYAEFRFNPEALKLKPGP